MILFPSSDCKVVHGKVLVFCAKVAFDMGKKLVDDLPIRKTTDFFGS